MAFGKPKKVGMARPKKKKIEVQQQLLEVAAAPAAEREAAGSPPPCAKQPRQPPSPGVAMRKEAKRVLNEEVKLMRFAEREYGKAKRALEVENRIYDAKVQALERAERRKPPPSAVGQLEKGRKADMRLVDAQQKLLLSLLDWQVCLGDASEALNECRELEIARLRRQLRARRGRKFV